MGVVRQFRLPGMGEAESETSNTDLVAIWMRGFKKFWALYPRKRSKREAEKAWMSLTPRRYVDFEEQAGQVLRLLGWYKRVEWHGWPKEKIPHPATWLRRESFERSDVDEVLAEGAER